LRAVVQRVSRAGVTVDGVDVATIGQGLMVFVGLRDGDGPAELDYLARKIVTLRVFEDAAGRMNLSVGDVGGSLLVVSQFTLYGDVARGNRPSFTGAAAGAYADEIYQNVCTGLRGMGCNVQNGVFGAHMEVSLVGDGPVTIIIETDSRKKRAE